MATIADWYEGQGLTKEASALPALLIAAGITKEAAGFGGVANFFRKLIGKGAKYTDKSGSFAEVAKRVATEGLSGPTQLTKKVATEGLSGPTQLTKAVGTAAASKTMAPGLAGKSPLTMKALGKNTPTVDLRPKPPPMSMKPPAADAKEGKSWVRQMLTPGGMIGTGLGVAGTAGAIGLTSMPGLMGGGGEQPQQPYTYGGGYKMASAHESFQEMMERTGITKIAKSKALGLLELLESGLKTGKKAVSDVPDVMSTPRASQLNLPGISRVRPAPLKPPAKKVELPDIIKQRGQELQAQAAAKQRAAAIQARKQAARDAAAAKVTPKQKVLKRGTEAPAPAATAPKGTAKAKMEEPKGLPSIVTAATGAGGPQALSTAAARTAGKTPSAKDLLKAVETNATPTLPGPIPSTREVTGAREPLKGMAKRYMPWLAAGGATAGLGAAGLGYAASRNKENEFQKASGLTKESGWLGSLAGKVIKGLGGGVGKTGWKLGASAGRGGGLERFGAKLLQRGKGLQEYGTGVAKAAENTGSLEDLAKGWKKFRGSNYFAPSVTGAALGTAGLGTGYLLGRD